MKNILYVSAATKLLSHDELGDILSISRKNNAGRGVTGVLLYSEGTIMQVLEGEEADVDYIFSKITADLRHKNIITLINEGIIHRSFADWSMGFVLPADHELKSMLGYQRSMRELNERPGITPSVATIQNFIEGNNLTINY